MKLKLNVIFETLGITKQFFDEFEPEMTLNQKNTFNDVGYGYVKKLSQKNDIDTIHILYEKRIEDLKNEINFLKTEITFLRDKL